MGCAPCAMAAMRGLGQAVPDCFPVAEIERCIADVQAGKEPAASSALCGKYFTDDAFADAIDALEDCPTTQKAWVLPAAIGGGAIVIGVLVYLMMRKS